MEDNWSFVGGILPLCLKIVVAVFHWKIHPFPDIYLYTYTMPYQGGPLLPEVWLVRTHNRHFSVATPSLWNSLQWETHFAFFLSRFQRILKTSVFMTGLPQFLPIAIFHFPPLFWDLCAALVDRMLLFLNCSLFSVFYYMRTISHLEFMNAEGNLRVLIMALRHPNTLPILHPILWSCYWD